MGEGRPAKRIWLRRLAWAAGICFVLLLLALVGLRLYFSDSYIKARLQQAVKSGLGRDLEISGLSVSLLSGNASLEGLRLLNADPAFKDPDTLRLSRATVRVALWPLVFSSGRKIEGFSVELEKPEIIVERRRTGPVEVSNIDDLLARLAAGPPGVWPKQTGLQALSGTVALRGGTVLFRDSDDKVGSSRVKDLDVNATFAGLGQPTQVKSSFALATPDEREGAATLEARVLWLQADGSINPAAFQDITCAVQLKGVDVAQLTRHLRMQAGLLDGKYQGTLGQPLSGTLKLEAPTLAQARLTANLETDGVVAIWQDGKRVAGNIPGRMDLDVQGGWRNGVPEPGQGRASVVLAASRANFTEPLLALQATAVNGNGAGSNYGLTLNARLDDLFATDVGTVLSLKGRIGGLVDAKVDASRQPDGRMKADGVFKTSQGYVMVGAARQPTALDAGFSANVQPDAQGRPERADVTFSAKAADSFDVRSLEPAVITSLNEPKKLAAQARWKLHVGGREFWKQFGPLLEVVNMRTPLEEELDAELQATGSAGKVKVTLNGTLQQQATTPQPLRLVANADYDGSALVDEPKSPYLIFDLRANSADKAISISGEGTATRGKTTHVISVPKFQALGELTALTALNKRFGAYVRLLLGPDYAVSGFIRQEAKTQLTQKLAPDGAVLSSDLNLTTDISLANFTLQGPALFPNSSPLFWSEKEATLQLGMVLKQSDAADTLSIQPATLKASSLRLDGQLGEADLARLKAAAAPSLTPAKLWLDALPFTRLTVEADPAALKQLQNIGVLPAEPLAVGSLLLKAQYDPNAHTVKLEALTFQHQPPLWSIKVAPAEIDAIALAAAADRKPFSRAALVAALPSLTLDATAQGEALRRLQERFSKAVEPLVLGDVTLRAQYDAKTRRGAVPELAFNGPDVVAKITASDADVPALAALADQPTTTAAQWLQLAPQLSFDVAVKPEAVKRLQKLDVLPAGAALAGNLSLRGTLDPVAPASRRHLRVERLVASSPAGNCALTAVALNLDKLGAFLDNPKRDAAAVAQLLPDFQLDLKAGPPLFESLRARKLLPEEFVLSGTVSLKARYDQAADRLAIETADFTRDAKVNAPLIALSASGEVAAVRSLIAQTPDDTAQLLAHADKGLNVKTLTYEARGLMQFHDVLLRPAGAPGVFDVTFSAETPIQYPPRPAPGQPSSPEPAGELAGTWSFDAAAPLRVNINPGALAARGTLNLDAAGLRYVVLDYKKPVNTPCKLKFDVTIGGDRVLRAPSVELAGGPVALSVADFVYNLGAQKPILTCAKLTVKTERVSATLSGMNIDMTRDSTQVRFVTVAAPADGLRLALSGEFNADQNHIVVRGLRTELGHTAVGKAESKVTLEGELDATSRVPNLAVLDAMEKPGLPLLVRISKARPDGTLHVDALVDACTALTRALSSGPSTGTGDMSGIKQLRVELSASAPELVAGSVKLQNVTVPNAVVDNLKLTVTEAAATLYGDGKATVHKGTIDLATMAHDGTLELANLNLNALTAAATKPTAEDYQLFGRLSGSGSVSGVGFSSAAFKTWLGAIQARIDGLTALKNEGKDSGRSVKKTLAGIGGVFLPGEAGLMLRIYGDDFGLFLNKLEFEPLTCAISLEKGRANIARSNLVGKGMSAGLKIEFIGGVNVLKSAFAPQMTLWLTGLPEKTQRVLRLHELEAADRQPFLAEFQQATFTPVVLTGKVAEPEPNTNEVTKAFSDLQRRIEKRINEKRTGDTSQQPPAQQPNQPPPAQPPAQPPPKKKDKFNPLDLFK